MKISAPELFEPKRPNYFTPERTAFLLENRFVDPAILAHHLGLSEISVRTYMRKIGLRRRRQQ